MKIVREENLYLIAFCPRCRKEHRYAKGTEKVIELAEDCKQYERLETLYIYNRKLFNGFYRYGEYDEELDYLSRKIPELVFKILGGWRRLTFQDARYLIKARWENKEEMLEFVDKYLPNTPPYVKRWLGLVYGN